MVGVVGARQTPLYDPLSHLVYVAQGSRFDKSGPQTEKNHLVLLAETYEGWQNLIKLSSAGYTEGFYYRPRIDKELLAQHAKGLIGLSSCLKGEVASALRVEQARPALGPVVLGRDDDPALAVDVAGDEMAAHAVRRAQAWLEIDPVAGT